MVSNDIFAHLGWLELKVTYGGYAYLAIIYVSDTKVVLLLRV